MQAFQKIWTTLKLQWDPIGVVNHALYGKLLYKPLSKVMGKGHFGPPQRRNPLADLDDT